MLSQTTEYALRAMTCLAHRPDILTPTPLLAEETRVPANYLAKVLQSLAQADLIKGRRGVGGGYRLARAAHEISMLDVVNAIAPLTREERARLAEEVADSPHLSALHTRLEEVTSTVSGMLAGVTLEDLAQGRGTDGSPPAEPQSLGTTLDEQPRQEADEDDVARSTHAPAAALI